MLACRLILAVVCSLQMHRIVSTQGGGHYFILAPGTLHSNSQYNVAVTVQDVIEQCKIRVSLEGPDFVQHREVEVSSMTLEMVQFEIPHVKVGNYKLLAEGVTGIIFRNSSALNFADNKPSVFIQTDKAKYKPGDSVYFHIVFLDENIRPAKINKSISVVIKDADQNLLKVFRNVTIIKGVYSEKFALSAFPVLGDWQIEVKLDGVPVQDQKFEVDKYVLPKFDVTVDVPKRVCLFDRELGFTVYAKYTFGKGVVGKAKVTVSTDSSNHFPGQGSYVPGFRPTYGVMQQPYAMVGGGSPLTWPNQGNIGSVWGRRDHHAKRSINVNGKAYIEFDMSEIVPDGISKPNSVSGTVFVEFEEELTGNKANKTRTFSLLWNRYDITANHNNVECDHLNATYTYTVIVSDLDGVPVSDGKHPVTLTNDLYPYSNNQLIEEASLNQQGIATFELKCSDHWQSPKIKYRGQETRAQFSHPLFMGGWNEQPGLQVLTRNPVIGNDIAIKFTAVDIISAFTYILVARGNILRSGLINLHGKEQHTHTFQITATFEMTPTCGVLVYYVKDNQLKFFETTISVSPQFENKAPRITKPGQNVTLHVDTDAGSFVGVMGIDQSVLVLKSGNNFQENDILKTLGQMTTTTPSEFLDSMSPYPGARTGIITLTNANYPHKKKPTYRSFDMRPSYGVYDRNLADFAGMAMASHSMAPQSLPRIGSGTSMAAYPMQTQFSPQVGSAVFTPPRVRKDFAESWFVVDFPSTDSNGLTFSKTVPDTITSWVVSGFSLNPRSGFTLCDNPANIRTFRPFFISTNLPYSVKRGEVVTIPVVVFNYMDQMVEAEITLDNSEAEFTFNDANTDQTTRKLHVTVPENGAATVEFSIRPDQIGHINLKLSALSLLAGDALLKKLKVEPEGITIYENTDFYVDALGSHNFTEKLILTIPNDIVLGSEHIEISLMGEVLGSTITNLDQLVRLPSGCGEQNMINFVPNILVLLYLESINQLIPTIEMKAKRYLEVGYQRELTYKHLNGAYSAFGTADLAGSTWLTAYVVRSFHQAARYIDVEAEILDIGLGFLSSIQAPNGSFPEYGKVLDFTHHNDVGLTAFVLLAFLECNELNTKYESVITAGFRYLEDNVQQTDDLYALSIAVYALQLHKSSAVDNVLAKLTPLAHVVGGRKWWSQTASVKKHTDQAWRPKSHDVEVTGYILMTLLERNEPVLPIIRWLIAQRNSNGGFASTQETVVGLQALTKFLKSRGAEQTNLIMNFESTGSNITHTSQLKVTNENAIEMQTEVLPQWVRELNFHGTGSGTAVVQVAYRYNILKKEKLSGFKLNTQIKPQTNPTQLAMEICTEFVPVERSDAEKKKQSNMVVMEVELPSGYTAKTEDFNDIKKIDNVKLVEAKNDDTKVVVYFDSLNESEVRCLPISAQRDHNVLEHKAVPVVIYDYYDIQNRATDFYQLLN